MNEEIIGTRLGDYEILAVLGAGGMGKVYKVRNVLSDRIEAMKVLLPNLADQKDLADRFLREIKVLASLSHPNIAALRTALKIDNQLVMIMEFIEGTTLGTRLEQGALPLGEALTYVSQVLAALSYAHKQQIIHRDIKPSNMMLTPEGVIKLMDFGIARSGPDVGLTMTGTTLGSLSYMSPEQVKCAPVDARSDLYSLGVSLYEMVTGQRPFQADSHFSILQAHLRELPKPPMELKPDLPVAVSQIILMAMEKDPARRFQSADAFLNAVQTAAGNQELAGAARKAGSTVKLETGAAPVRRESTVAMTGSGASRATPGTPLAPENAPVAVAQASHQKYRGLYIGLGALIVVLILVAAGISAPNWLKTRAKDGASARSRDASAKSAADAAASSQPVTSATPSAPTVATVPEAASAAANPAAVAQPARAAGKNRPAVAAGSGAAKNSAGSGRQAGPPGEPQQGEGAASAQPAEPEEGQFDATEKAVDQLSGRETALSASLDNLQKQQNAHGWQLRGDIAAAQARLRTYLGKAQAALQAQDLKSAQKYLKLAEPEAEKIERFLGR